MKLLTQSSPGTQGVTRLVQGLPGCMQTARAPDNYKHPGLYRALSAAPGQRTGALSVSDL